MMIVITALVQVASEVVCDISAFHSAMPKHKGGNDESGGAQHSAGKRVVLTRNSKAESSGGSHSADDLVVLFLDENNLDSECDIDESDLIYDPRPRLDPDELEDILLEKCADIAIRVASVGPDRIAWNFTCSTSCRITNETMVKLARRYPATSITLQRLTPCNDGKTIKFLLLKTLKGKPNGPADWFLSAANRKDLAYEIFDRLLAEGPLTYVIGNIGFALSSIVQFAREYAAKMNQDVVSNLKVVTTPDQNLSCIYYQDSEKHFHPFVDTDTSLPPRILSLWMQAVQDSSEKASSSSGSHPAVGAAVHTSSGSHQANSNSQVDEFLKMLAETTAEEHFAQAMLHPVVSRKWSNFDGPVDVTATIHLIRSALELAQRAREYAGVEISNRALSEKQPDKAFRWLKDHFEKHFLTNTSIKKMIENYDDELEKMNRKEKNKARQLRRGSFKAWMNSLMGNGQLFRAIVKYGFFDTQSFAHFMRAFTEMQVEARNSGDIRPTASEREEARANARMARANLREGRRLSKTRKLLTPKQGRLLCRFQRGELEREVLDANQKYSHGQGVTRMSTEDAVLYLSLIHI